MAMILEASEYGEGMPIAILHGLFGSSRNWTSIAQHLSRRHRVIAFDLRNHGASPWADTMTYREMAEDVRAMMLVRGHHRYALIGHSMGGKIAMVAALAEPDAIVRLVVVDIAPTKYPLSYLGYVQRMRGLDLDTVIRRRDADAQLMGAVPDTAERAFLLQNLVFGDRLPPRWRLNLAAIEAAMPEIADFPAVPRGSTYEGPALFISGGRSRSLLPEHEPAITTLFPKATVAQIANAGHWVHAEQPDAFLAMVEPFLSD